MMEIAVSVIAVISMGLVGWAFNMSNRLAVAEANNESLVENFESKTAIFIKLLDVRFSEIDRRLQRIENMMKLVIE